MPEQSYRPLILQVSWRRMIVLLTSLALALSVVLTVVLGEAAVQRLHLVVALGFGGVFGAAVLLFVVLTLADKHLWAAALNAGVNTLLGVHRSLVGAEAMVGRTAVVVSAFALSADGRRVGQVQLGGETWRAQLESRSSPLPAVGAPVKVVELRGLTAVVRV